jgi:hypothetical protein
MKYIKIFEQYITEAKQFGVKDIMKAFKNKEDWGDTAEQVYMKGGNLVYVDTWFYGEAKAMKQLEDSWKKGGSNYDFWNKEHGVDFKIVDTFSEVKALGRHKKLTSDGIVGVVLKVTPGKVTESIDEAKKAATKFVDSIKESVVNEKLARGLKPLLKTGSTITKKVGEDALLDLSDKFDSIDDEYAGTIASHLDMAIELMQDGYPGDATKKLKQFNKACKDVLNGKEVGSAFESVVTEAMDLNDPVLVAFRRTRAIMELPKFKSAEVKSRRISFDKYMDLLDSQADINQDIKDKAEEMAQTLRDMEQEAEPEGGAIADKYGSIMMKQEKEYAQLKAKKAKIDARIEKYKMS